jgi:hypothetical protein
MKINPMAKFIVAYKAAHFSFVVVVVKIIFGFYYDK